MKWLLLSFLVSAAAAQLSNCPYLYSSGGDGYCYKAVNLTVQHNVAAQACWQDGAWLASIPNAFVNSVVYGMCQQIGDVWIGFSNATGPSWDDGTVSTYTNVQKYGAYATWSMDRTDGRWYPNNQYSQKYICKKPDPGSAPCFGWTHDPSSNSCFKGFQQALNLSQAENICSQNCGHLAYITNNVTNQLLPHVFMKYAKDFPQYARIGLKHDQDNYFRWTNGQVFDPYTSFSNFVVMNAANGDCVNMYVNDIYGRAQWVNADCRQNIPFICYREANACDPSPPRMTTPRPVYTLPPAQPSTTYMLSFFMDLSGYSAQYSQAEEQIDLLQQLGSIIRMNNSNTRFVIGAVGRGYTITGNATNTAMIRPLVQAGEKTLVYPDTTYNLAAAVSMFSIQGWQYDYATENPPIAIYLATREPLGGTSGMLEPSMNTLKTKNYKFLGIDLSGGADIFIMRDFKQLLGASNCYQVVNTNFTATAQWIAKKIAGFKPN